MNSTKIHEFKELLSILKKDRFKKANTLNDKINIFCKERKIKISNLYNNVFINLELLKTFIDFQNKEQHITDYIKEINFNNLIDYIEVILYNYNWTSDMIQVIISKLKQKLRNINKFNLNIKKETGEHVYETTKRKFPIFFKKIQQ